MNFKSRSEITDKLVELMNESKLSYDQKQKVCTVVKNLKNTTDIQKDRFISFYGLDKNSDKGQKLGEIAEKYNCSTTAIRRSVVSVKNKLSRLNENVEIIKKIIDENNNSEGEN